MISGINSRLSFLSSSLRKRFSDELTQNIFNTSMCYNRIFSTNNYHTNDLCAYPLIFELNDLYNNPTCMINGEHISQLHNMEVTMRQTVRCKEQIIQIDTKSFDLQRDYLPTDDCNEYSNDLSNMSITMLFFTINAELQSYIGNFNINELKGRFNLESDILKYDISIGIFYITLRFTVLNGLLISIIHDKNRYINIKEKLLFKILKSNSPKDILLRIEQNVFEQKDEDLVSLENKRLVKEEILNDSLEMQRREFINNRNKIIFDYQSNPN
jgi:hypothetical protein